MMVVQHALSWEQELLEVLDMKKEHRGWNLPP